MADGEAIALVGAAFAFGGSTMAQAPPVPPGGTLVAAGLQGPRGLTFGPDGLLYIAEAGTGGTQPVPAGCPNVVNPVGPYHGGLTARVSRIESDGTRTTVIGNLPSSISTLPSGDTEGVADVAFVDGQLYAVTAGGGCSHGNPNFPNSVIRVNVKHGTGQIIANLSKFFFANPVAHPNDGPTGDFEPDGVPYHMREFQGDLIVRSPTTEESYASAPAGGGRRSSKSATFRRPSGISCRRALPSATIASMSATLDFSRSWSDRRSSTR